MLRELMRWPVAMLESGDLEEVELEAHHTLLTDRWKQLFDKYDPEGFGEIPCEEFLEALDSAEFQEAIEPRKRQILAIKAEEHKTSSISFEDFISVMSGKRTRSFTIAVHHRDREVWSEHDFHLLTSEPGIFHRMVHVIAHEFLPDERDRKYYSDNYSCCPPPFFVVIITLIELGMFIYYTVTVGNLTSAGPVPIDSTFVYRPDKRSQFWRYIFYMILHAGWVHLVFNLLIQVFVGMPLEMIHGSLRIGTVYMAGILAGSLGTSVFDKGVYLVGASGGVYALLVAHLANVVLHFNQMEIGVLRLIGVFVITSADIGFAIYDRYSIGHHGTPVSYVAHFMGALTGLTIGLLVLKNFEQRLREQLLWWIALGVYGACALFAILFNVFSG